MKYRMLVCQFYAPKPLSSAEHEPLFDDCVWKSAISGGVMCEGRGKILIAISKVRGPAEKRSRDKTRVVRQSLVDQPICEFQVRKQRFRLVLCHIAKPTTLFRHFFLVRLWKGNFLILPSPGLASPPSPSTVEKHFSSSKLTQTHACGNSAFIMNRFRENFQFRNIKFHSILGPVCLIEVLSTVETVEQYKLTIAWKGETPLQYG